MYISIIYITIMYFTIMYISIMYITIMYITIIYNIKDIAVDGWAITMLKPENAGYAATCSILGVQLGWQFAYVVFTTLEARGVLDLSQFLLVCGVVFLVTTLALALLKREKSVREIQESREGGVQEELELNLTGGYKLLWRMVWSPRMLVWIIFQLTGTFAFSAAESIFQLKLVELGVPRENIAQLALPMVPVKLITVLLISRFSVH